MIRLDDARQSLNAALLRAPGGFAWWYVELLGEGGDGLVLIWSFGLPFLPGYTSAARRGEGEAAGQRPSLNVALYRAGRLDAYVLHEFQEEEARWSGNEWRFGQTHIRLSCEDGQGSLEVDLDCPLRGSNGSIRGRVRVGGPFTSLASGASRTSLGSQEHAWTPVLCPAFGTASLHLPDGQRVCVSGRAYHDRNGSPHTLDALGFRLWAWGHCAMQERERIFYVLWPREADDASPVVAGFELGCDGVITPVEGLTAKLDKPRKTLLGMQTWRSIELWEGGRRWMTLPLRKPVDHGPFYLRYLGRATMEGEPCCCEASAEVIDPSRVDLGAHRFFVKMRVASDQRENSMWLPLFQGPKAGRVGRLLRSVFGGKAPKELT